MREVIFDFRHSVRKFGGYQGEHNETNLKVVLPSNMQDLTKYDFLTFVFQTAEDKKIEGVPIETSKVESKDGQYIVSTLLWNQLLENGILQFCIQGKKIVQETNEVSLIAQTPTGSLIIEPSPAGAGEDTDLDSEVPASAIEKLSKELSNKADKSELANKVDKINGKGLSTNDYTDTDKSIVDNAQEALAGKLDKITQGDYQECMVYGIAPSPTNQGESLGSFAQLMYPIIMDFDPDTAADALPYYGAGGTLKVGTPTTQYDATNKNYVDNAIASAITTTLNTEV